MINKREKKKSWRKKNWPSYMFSDGKFWERFKEKFRVRNKFSKYKVEE